MPCAVGLTYRAPVSSFFYFINVAPDRLKPQHIRKRKKKINCAASKS